jgi:D-beta-D-heptose 7-phosphate kinase/D-beta-D-heptose 1-phosphate adenosyltransferase
MVPARPDLPLRPHDEANALLRRARRAFAGRRVLVVGDAILDGYRLSGGKSACFAGGAAVIAGHLRQLGADPTLVTLVGRDRDSQQLMKLIEAQGIVCEALPLRAELPTRIRHVHGSSIIAQRRLELFQPPPADTVGRVAGAVAELRTQLDAAIFTDFGYGTVCPALLDGLLPTLRPHVPLLAGDVSGPRASLLAMRRFDWLTPTEAELRRLTPSAHARPDLHDLARRMVRELALGQLLVTRDRHGCIRFDADGAAHPAASPASAIVDEVGAGDALLAVSTLALSAGFHADDAVRLGQTAAAAAVARLGNAPVTWDRLARAAAVREPAPASDMSTSAATAKATARPAA